MDWMKYVLTGGWLAGYRTQIAAGLLILNFVAGYFMGDIWLMEAFEESWKQLVIALGLVAASVHKG